MVTTAFCVRCRKMVDMEEEKTVKYRNGRLAKKGVCPECGGKVCKVISSKGSLFPMG
jgi:hypothetical protein